MKIKQPAAITQTHLGFWESLVPDRALGRIGEWRQASGRVNETIVSQFAGVDPIDTHGGYDICFDAHRDGTYYEIKSVKLGAEVAVYKWRLEKELSVTNPVRYLFGIYSDTSVPPSLAQLWSARSGQFLGVASIPLRRLEESVKGLTLKTPVWQDKSRRNGYARHGYRDGYYRVPLARLIENCHTVYLKSVEVFGFDFTGFLTEE